MRPWIKYGLAFGIATCAWTLAEYLLGFHTTRIGWGQVSSYAALVLPIAFITRAARAQKRRDAATGVLGYLATALAVMLLGYVVLMPFQLFYHHVLNPHWLEHLVAYERHELEVGGTAPDQIEARVRALAAGNSDAAQLIGGLFGSVVVGLLIGLPTALVLRPRVRGGAAPAA